mgnify:CR=1 FL=1
MNGQPTTLPTQLSPEQVQAAVQQARQRYPTIDKTKDERYLDFILNPKVPKDPRTDRLYPFSTEAAVHLQLTNIPDLPTYFRLKNMVIDLFRIEGWDAPEYLQLRLLKFFSEIQMLKSAGWTKNPRERDALNESRQQLTLRDDRTPLPRESNGFLAGFFNR